MASHEKEVVNDREKTIKIIGVNHGYVFHRFLLLDGWRKELFTVRSKLTFAKIFP